MRTSSLAATPRVAIALTMACFVWPAATLAQQTEPLHTQSAPVQAVTAPQTAAQPTTARRPAETGPSWNGHPSVRLGDGSRIDLHARVQSDYQVRDDAETDVDPQSLSDRLSVPRKRVGLTGVLFDRVEFQIEGEIGDDRPWRDVYADVRVIRGLRLRAGQFKVPFSQEQLTSSADRDFIARPAAVADLSPARDFGVLAHGRVADRAVKYEAGVFEAGTGTRLWKTQSLKTMAARVTLAPLAEGDSRGSDALEFSAAIARSDVSEGRGGSDGHLVMGDTFFRSMFVNGTRTRLGVGATWQSARLSIKGEALRSIETRLGQGVDGGDLSNLVADGGYLSAVWHVVPQKGPRRHASILLRGVDVGARFDRLMFGSQAQNGDAFLNPRADHVAPIGRNAWTGGATWYVNRWVKVQGNGVREQLVDPLSLLPLGTTPLWSATLRFQVSM